MKKSKLALIGITALILVVASVGYLQFSVFQQRQAGVYVYGSPNTDLFQATVNGVPNGFTFSGSSGISTNVNLGGSNGAVTIYVLDVTTGVSGTKTITMQEHYLYHVTFNAQTLDFTVTSQYYQPDPTQNPTQTPIPTPATTYTTTFTAKVSNYPSPLTLLPNGLTWAISIDGGAPITSDTNVITVTTTSGLHDIAITSPSGYIDLNSLSQFSVSQNGGNYIIVFEQSAQPTQQPTPIPTAPPSQLPTPTPTSIPWGDWSTPSPSQTVNNNLNLPPLTLLAIAVMIIVVALSVVVLLILRRHKA